jgi:hypothetical protein
MESPSIPPAPDPPLAPIVGHVTSWYFYRRMGPLVAVLLFMGLFFLYDGAIGYPQANAIADKKAWLETEVLKSYDEAKAQGPAQLEAWKQRARATGWPLGKSGEPLPWVSWAAERSLPENPRHWSDAEIAQQYGFGGACILAALIVACVALSNRGKTVRAESDHWITPHGKKIPFASVVRLDLRKWQRQGLAYAWYRETAHGPLRKAVLDDFKFTHMQAILDRLRAHFKGDLIENGAKETASAASAKGS